MRLFKFLTIFTVILLFTVPVFVLEVTDDGGSTWEPVSETAISWSDDPLVCQGGVTFGLRFYPAPSAVMNLRPVSN
jgi:hypothetical protein